MLLLSFLRRLNMQKSYGRWTVDLIHLIFDYKYKDVNSFQDHKLFRVQCTSTCQISSDKHEGFGIKIIVVEWELELEVCLKISLAF